MNTGIVILLATLFIGCARQSINPENETHHPDQSLAGSKRDSIEFTRMDSLFIAASTGHPRFGSLRDSAHQIMLQAPAKSLHYLLTHRIDNQTARRRHYIQRFFAEVSDSGQNKLPAEMLAQALQRVPDSTKSFLLWVGSKMEDSNVVDMAVPFVSHDSLSVRLMAIRAIGSFPRMANEKLLLEGLNSAVEPERHQRLWALSRMDSVSGWQSLLFLIHDPFLHNRRLLRSILAKNTGFKGLLPYLERFKHQPLFEWFWVLIEMKDTDSLDYIQSRKADLSEKEKRSILYSLNPDLPFDEKVRKILKPE